MQIYLDCYPCFLRQALQAARLAEGSLDAQHTVMQQTLQLLQTMPADATPPQIARDVHRLVRRIITSNDPYKAAKARDTAAALELYPRLKELVAASTDPFDTALRLAIAGNIIDMGVKDDYGPLWHTVERVLAASFALDARDALRRQLDEAEWVLYLADNTGETVFDRVFIESLQLPVVYAVKGQPVLNDATRADALAAGISCEIIDNGADAPGTILRDCSASFQERFAQAPLIIAKGQGNYESLSTVDAPLFFLLQAKCPVIAHDLGVAVGSIICTTPA